MNNIKWLGFCFVAKKYFQISLAVKQYICEARPFALLKLDMELNLVILFTKNLSLFILPKKSLMTQNGTSVSHAYD